MYVVHALSACAIIKNILSINFCKRRILTHTPKCIHEQHQQILQWTLTFEKIINWDQIKRSYRQKNRLSLSKYVLIGQFVINRELQQHATQSSFLTCALICFSKDEISNTGTFIRWTCFQHNRKCCFLLSSCRLCC